MRPIELTRTINGKRVTAQVNPDLIACVTAAHDGYETSISFESGWTITVAETPEQIISRLAEHRSSTGVDLGALPVVGVDWGPA